MVGTARNEDRTLTAIGLRLTSAGFLASMAAAIKLAEAGGAHLAEILFWRQAGATILVTAIIAHGPGLRSVATRRLSAHVWRAVVGMTSMACLFSAVLILPLAEATTLQFTVPIFATILGALVLREPTGWHRWGAVILGFVGILIVTRPGSGHVPLLGVAAGLTAGLLTAIVSILLRQIGRTETSLTTVFWFSLLSLVPLAPFYALDLRAHSTTVWLFLGAVGVFGALGQITLTAALRLAPVSVVVPMDYSMIIWATLYGWLLFGVLPGMATLLGAPVVIASGLYIVWRERVRHLRETEQAIVD
jgi:drug/metabolite transporter (DMT)-like permease